MESKEASSQLTDLERLRGETIRESYRSPRGTFVVLSIAVVAFFTAYAVTAESARGWLPALWTLFIVAWATGLRHSRRAVPAGAHRTLAERRRMVRECIGLFFVANLIVIFASRVSWTLVGLLLAMLGAMGGSVLAWRSRRS
jgi:hypothetical protein